MVPVPGPPRHGSALQHLSQQPAPLQGWPRPAPALGLPARPLCPRVTPATPARPPAPMAQPLTGNPAPHGPAAPGTQTPNSTGQGAPVPRAHPARARGDTQPVPGVTPALRAPARPRSSAEGTGTRWGAEGRAGGGTRAAGAPDPLFTCWHQGRMRLSPCQPPATSCRRLCQAGRLQCHPGARLPGAGPAAGPEGGLWAPTEPLTPPGALLRRASLSGEQAV